MSRVSAGKVIRRHLHQSCIIAGTGTGITYCRRGRWYCLPTPPYTTGLYLPVAATLCRAPGLCPSPPPNSLSRPATHPANPVLTCYNVYNLLPPCHSFYNSMPQNLQPCATLPQILQPYAPLATTFTIPCHPITTYTTP